MAVDDLSLFIDGNMLALEVACSLTVNGHGEQAILPPAHIVLQSRSGKSHEGRAGVGKCNALVHVCEF